MNPQLPADFKLKSFWEKPEGTTGMIVTLLMLGGLGWLGYVLLPFIIKLLAGTVTAIILAAVVFSLLWLIFNPRFQTLVGHLFKSAMRRITQIFIEIDPIGILKNYVEHLRSELLKMDKQIANLKGQIRVLQGSIEANEKARQEALGVARQASKDGVKQVFTLKARKAGRLGESNMTLQQLLNKMELLYRVLLKMRETSEIFIEDMSDEVAVKERERKMIMAGHSAIKSAMAIMRGDSDKASMFQQTMEYLAEDYGRKMGEIEDFVRMSSGFIQSVDLQNGVYEEEALKMLEQWEQKSDSLLLPPGAKQEIIFAANDADTALDLDAVPVPVARRPKSDGKSPKAWENLVK